jgi:hypothetical protein
MLDKPRPLVEMSVCQQCFPEGLRQSVYEAGKRAGLVASPVQPFPVGAVLKADWDRGYEEGLDSLVAKPKGRKGKR